MKLLCVPCDEPMEFAQCEGPEEGSMAVVFRCPKCQHQIALLTNPWETQLVRSLGVKIGGRAESETAQPMELVREALTQQRPGSFEGVDQAKGPLWTEEARKKLERVPEIVRPMAQREIERYAQEQGHRKITPEVMDEARAKMGL